MKAALVTEFGPPDVLRVEEIPTPTPTPDEVLIRIYAATVCAEDPGMRAAPGLNGLWKPTKPILGEYFAGEIAEVGSNVTQWAPGDRVYGNTAMKYLGAHAEYLCLPAEWALVPMPSRLTYAEAAALPNGALTALPFLRDKGSLQADQRILINGASGAVGSTGVQLAKAFGAEVTGVCSRRNVDLVRSLGADHVISYTTEDITQGGRTYHVIFDAVGKIPFAQAKTMLTPDGIYLTTVPLPGPMLHGLLPWGTRVGFAATGLRPADKKRADLLATNRLIEDGHLDAVIDRCYPLEEIAEAHRYVETGRKRGNVVITMQEETA